MVSDDSGTGLVVILSACIYSKQGTCFFTDFRRQSHKGLNVGTGVGLKTIKLMIKGPKKALFKTRLKSCIIFNIADTIADSYS